MRTIEERAQDYARMTESDHPEIVAHDYASGAREEHILLTEWHDATEKAPEVGERVLCKLTNGIIAVGLRRTDNLYMLDTQAILTAPKYVKWRKIHE